MSAWGWPQWAALAMSVAMLTGHTVMMLAKDDKDFAIAILWSGLWVWVLWMGGFWG